MGGHGGRSTCAGRCQGGVWHISVRGSSHAGVGWAAGRAPMRWPLGPRLGLPRRSDTDPKHRPPYQALVGGAWGSPGAASREGAGVLSEIPFPIPVLTFADFTSTLSVGASSAVAEEVHSVALSLPPVWGCASDANTQSPWLLQEALGGRPSSKMGVTLHGGLLRHPARAESPLATFAGQPAETRPTPRLRGGARRWIVPSRQSSPQCSRSGAARAATKKRLRRRLFIQQPCR